jgi:hypothetical protein
VEKRNDYSANLWFKILLKRRVFAANLWFEIIVQRKGYSANLWSELWRRETTILLISV